MKKTIALILFAVLLLSAAGCGNASTAPAESTSAAVVEEGEPIPLDTVLTEILDTVELPDMMKLTIDDLMDFFGLESAWYKDAAACVNANGYEKEEVILVHAASAQDVQSITECLQTSLKNAATEMQNYLPEQYAMIQKCSVQSKGLYVWLFISDANDQMQAILDKYL
ncbi:MAG: DUF4358 domain-containing protein [Clostridia bacterium]|nr:DUF4358 domain-containing protein [Clostridia bacterium]